MKLFDYNIGFQTGKYSDEDVYLRSNNMTNIECDLCNSHMKQGSKYKKDPISYLVEVYCLYCAKNIDEYRRTRFARFIDFVQSKQEDTTK